LFALLTKGAVLCGGQGKRLKPLTDYFQKTMVPIGSKGRPLLEYVIRLLVWHKVNKLSLLTGYRSEQIENYFGDGSRFGAEINYSRDQANGLGSARALAIAVANRNVGKFDNLLIYYGDVLSDLNITDLLRLHDTRRASVTLVLSRKYALPVGVAEVENGVVVKFKEKPTTRMNVTTGCMVISSGVIDILKKMKRGSDLMAHFVPEVIREKENVIAFYANDFWYDVGTTEAYERLNNTAIENHLSFLS
jgi:mannose-1-phosphate guanylyltransferase